MTYELLIFVLLGLLAGLLSSLFGLGGGVVIVPTLLWLLPQLGMDLPSTMLVAVSTSLVSTFFVTNLAMMQHSQRHAVDFVTLRKMGIGIALGAFMGAMAAKSVSGEILQLVFALFLVVFGAYQLLMPKPHPQEKIRKIHGIVMNLCGGLVGFLATFLGVAGGFISLPFLFFMGFSARIAVGTACGVGAIITTVGTFSYLLEDMKKIDFHDMFGTVYLPAALIIGLASFSISPYAVSLAHRLPVEFLRRALGVVLLLIGATLFWR